MNLYKNIETSKSVYYFIYEKNLKVIVNKKYYTFFTCF